MTDKEMEQEIVKKTGYSSSVVRHVLDVQASLIRECLFREESVVFKKLFRITSGLRGMSLRDPKTGNRSNKKVMMLSVRPIRSFRKELTKWTSTV
tara:strand:+ start:570 stop:854 length:285 start_codon:yes stop_codon:yes gene_type:complete